MQEKVTPDSQKSYTEKASENISGTYDKVASAVQPGNLLRQRFQAILKGLTTFIESEKSTTQKIGDSTRSTADNAQNDGKGMMQSAQETVGNVANAAADNVKVAGKHSIFCSMSKQLTLTTADYVTGASQEATTS